MSSDDARPSDLAAWISPEMVFEPLSAVDAAGALRELADRLATVDGRFEPSAVAAALAEREALGSTALGDGVAVPHCKVDDASRVRVGVTSHPAGIEFGSPDGLPVRLFFVVVSPRLATGSHLQALAAIARSLGDPELRQRLLAARSAAELRSCLGAFGALERAS